jgi:hypothetical protein
VSTTYATDGGISQAIDGDTSAYDDGPELGILLRTDYSNEESWQAFLAQLQESEKELWGDIEAEMMDTTNSNSEPPVAPSQTMDIDDADAGDDSDSDTDNELEQNAPLIFKIINPTSPLDREALTNISNLTALRLLNDVDKRRSPTPPVGTSRINPPNRLIDHGGWQEIYKGKSIWIYDSISNSDQSVRVVSQQGDIYGTAT